MIQYQIKGGKELDALLQLLPVEVETKILRNGVAAGAAVIRDEARSLVRKRSGQLAAAIKTTSSANRSEGYVVAKVKLKGPHSFVGNFLEHGVAAHRIWVRDGKRGLVINGVNVGKEVWHPGFGPMPFMRPALDNKASAAVQAVGDYLTRYLSWGTITAPTIAVDEQEAA